jgi:hypothetical protein
LFYLGGHGGTGLGTSPGAGGSAIFNTLGATSNNVFQPSVYNNAMIFTNWAEGLIRNNLAGPASTGMIFGGAGGGGAGTGVGTAAAGGVGGGVVYISCNRLIMNGGSITANGQPSSNGGAGGGGVIIIVCSELVFQSGTSYIEATGMGSGIQASGSGQVLLFSNTLVASFSPGLVQAQYLAALQTYQAR